MRNVLLQWLFTSADRYTNFPRFQGSQRDQVPVQSSSCCFPRASLSFVRPRASLSFDQWHVTRSPPIKKRIWVGKYNKITCYLHTWRDHRRYGYKVNRAFFTGVYITNRILHPLLWKWILSSRYLTRSLRSLVRSRVGHSKTKFISTFGHIISGLHVFYMSLFGSRSRNIKSPYRLPYISSNENSEKLVLV